MPCVRLHEVRNPHLNVVKHGELLWMEQAGLGEVAHDVGNMLKHVESLVNMA